MINLRRSIIQICEGLIKKSFKENMDPLIGRNGPYDDPETEIRSLAHKLCFLANLDFNSKQINNKEQCLEILERLLSNEYRLDNHYFIMRFKEGKDQTNGVIGLAWVVEGVSCAYRTYQFDLAKKFLQTIEKNLVFEQKLKLWRRPSISKPYEEKVDKTFNHQLWLAYALAFKANVLGEKPSAEVQEFFKNIDEILEINSQGRVGHMVMNREVSLKSMLRQVKYYIKYFVHGKRKSYKENGYHLFSVFAFARIKQEGFEWLFKHSAKVNQVIEYSINKSLHRALNTNMEETDYYSIEKASNLEYNRYGIPYNVSGLELYFISKIFHLKICEPCYSTILNQLEVYNSLNSKTLQTEDRSNLILRSYEISFLNEN